MIDETERRIHELAKRRQEIWAGAASEPGEVKRLTTELEELYRERRAAATQAAVGRTRSEIVRRARVESELERLISR